MATEVSGIPVVDFSAMSLEQKDPLKTNKKAVDILADQIFHAFSTIGFVYLKNHGIPQELVDSAFETFDKFFYLERDVKEKYAKTKGTSQDGWDALERERLNLERPGDLKESFDIANVYDENFNWPNAEIPTFQSTITSLYQNFTNLGLRVLSAMAIGLKLDPNAFDFAYKNMGYPAGCSVMRCNFYPLMDSNEVKVGQIRCGEHTDYGAITLLFQDDIGGLEVANVQGEFVPATPMEGTVVVNIADLMQRWTSDRLISTIHRVLVPEIELKQRVPRRSLAFFVHPDGEALIKSLDGRDKYPPTTAREWIQRKLRATYRY